MQRDMAPARGTHGTGPGHDHPGLRRWGFAGQARAAHAGLAMAALLALSACVGAPAESPFEFFRQITGDPLGGRPTPSGLDSARPNFSVLPPRPDRGPAETRAELSAALAANRAAAANPAPVGAPVPPRPDTEGAALLAAGPPPAARLRPAPPVGTGPATLTLPGGRGTPPQEMPQMGPVPEAPPADLLAPAPPNLANPPPIPRL